MCSNHPAVSCLVGTGANRDAVNETLHSPIASACCRLRRSDEVVGHRCRRCPTHRCPYRPTYLLRPNCARRQLHTARLAQSSVLRARIRPIRVRQGHRSTTPSSLSQRLATPSRPVEPQSSCLRSEKSAIDGWLSSLIRVGRARPRRSEVPPRAAHRELDSHQDAIGSPGRAQQHSRCLDSTGSTSRLCCGMYSSETLEPDALKRFGGRQIRRQSAPDQMLRGLDIDLDFFVQLAITGPQQSRPSSE